MSDGSGGGGCGSRPMSDGRHRRARATDGPWKGLNPTMALAAKGFVLAFVLFAIRDMEAAGAAFERVRVWIEGTLDWYYILAVCACLFACVFLACSRFGRIRLGDDDAEPEFRTSSWLAMLFSAGVGIGLLFFSIAEPPTGGRSACRARRFSGGRGPTSERRRSVGRSSRAGSPQRASDGSPPARGSAPWTASCARTRRPPQ